MQKLGKGMQVLIRNGVHKGKRGKILNMWGDKPLVAFDSGTAAYIDNAVIQVLEGRKFYPVKDAPADTVLPIRSTEGSAAYDFILPCDLCIKPRSSSKLIYLNIKCKMPLYEYLQLHIRSSLAVKKHLILESSGVIDSDYFENPVNDGNIGIQFYNTSDKWVRLKKGERCCQGIFSPFLIADDDDAFDKKLRTGGFGSTGK